MKSIRMLTAVLTLTLFLFPAAFSQEKVDAGMVNRIWEEGVNRSKIMETLSYLTDVFGRLPRAKTTDIHDLLPANWKPQPANTS